MKNLTSALALCAAVLFAAPAYAASHAGAPMAKDGKDAAACEKSADDKKLAGAARTSHVKKCMGGNGGGGAAAACEKSADDKKLAGAARTSHVKKCTTDAAAKKG